MNQQQFNSIPKNERIRYLSGTIFYASVHVVNRTPEKLFNALPEYVVTMVLDKENQAKAESYGLKVKQPKEDEKAITGPYVVLKRKVKNEDTDPTAVEKARPRVIDSEQNLIPQHCLIGNGSEGTVKFGTYWYENFGGGVGSTLFTLQVNELVPYEGGAGGIDPNLSSGGRGFKASSIEAPSPSVADSVIEETVDEGDIFD